MMKKFHSNDAEGTYFISTMSMFIWIVLTIGVSVTTIRMLQNAGFFGLPAFLMNSIIVIITAAFLFLAQFITVRIFRHIFGF